MEKLTDFYQSIDESADKLHLAIKANLTNQLAKDKCGCAELALTIAMLASGNYYLGHERFELSDVDIACLEAVSFTRDGNRIIEDGDILDMIRNDPDKWHERIMSLQAEYVMRKSQVTGVHSIYVNNYSQKVMFSKNNFVSLYKAFNMNDEEQERFNGIIKDLLSILT